MPLYDALSAGKRPSRGSSRARADFRVEDGPRGRVGGRHDRRSCVGDTVTLSRLERRLNAVAALGESLISSRRGASGPSSSRPTPLPLFRVQRHPHRAEATS
jgi:hypothetical protein